MKILHIIDNWGLGGAQRALSNWAKYDTENEHEIISLFQHGALKWGDYEVTFLGKSFQNLIGVIFKLRKFIRIHNPDFITLHLDGSRLVYAIATIGISKKHKLIWLDHSGNILINHYGKFLGTLLQKIQKQLSKKVDIIIAVSEEIKKECERTFYAPVRKIFNPVDEAMIEREALQTLSNVPPGIDDKQRIIGFVGRLEPEKGILTFIDIAQDLASRWDAVQFWIVGDGSLMSQTRSRVKEYPKLEGKVFFWGLRQDVFAIMNKMDILLMPSKKETFGLVAVEAFVLRKYVVGYQVGGLTEVLTHSPWGIVVSENNKESFVKKVNNLILNFNQDRINWDNPFQAKIIVKEFQELYDQLLSQSGIK